MWSTHRAYCKATDGWWDTKDHGIGKWRCKCGSQENDWNMSDLPLNLRECSFISTVQAWRAWNNLRDTGQTLEDCYIPRACREYLVMSPKIKTDGVAFEVLTPSLHPQHIQPEQAGATCVVEPRVQLELLFFIQRLQDAMRRWRGMWQRDIISESSGEWRSQEIIKLSSDSNSNM